MIFDVIYRPLYQTLATGKSLCCWSARYNYSTVCVACADLHEGPVGVQLLLGLVVVAPVRPQQSLQGSPLLFFP